MSHSQIVVGVVQLGFGSGLSLGGPTTINACKSYPFTEGSFKVENKEYLVDFLSHFILSHFGQMHYTVAKCHS